ncbi:MAG: 50S ribosomal protein L17 [Deltaproteobacteria bacterium]|nr:50S ribosomal protein L17 [Deltaproteobacteria bacterium]
MRHLDDHRKLGRTTPHRKALFRNMMVALIQHGRIKTTLPKAKELKRLADRIVTLGKKGTVAARRRARLYIHDRAALTKVFSELGPRFSARNGGYTRLLKLDLRAGDLAPMALLEYLDNPPPAPRVKAQNKKAKAK